MKNYYGYIYITTNKINGKKYIGLHTKFNKNYLGSGKIFKRALEKYGKDNFEQKILYYARTKDELYLAEKLFIRARNAVKNPMYYNIHEGGFGGWTIAGYTDEQLEAYKQKMKETITELYKNNHEIRIKISENVKKAFDENHTHEKLSEIMKDKWSNDENYRNSVIEGIQKMYKNAVTK